MHRSSLIGLFILLCVVVSLVMVPMLIGASNLMVWEDGSTNDKQWTTWVVWGAGETEVEPSSDWSTTGGSSLRVTYKTIVRDGWQATIFPSKKELSFDEFKNARTVVVDVYNPTDRVMKFSFWIEDGWGRHFTVKEVSIGDECPLYADLLTPGEHTFTFDLSMLWQEPNWENPITDTSSIVADIRTLHFRIRDIMEGVEGRGCIYIDNIRIGK